MTVAELIEALQQCPQSALVKVYREGYPMSEEDNDPKLPELVNGIVEL